MKSSWSKAKISIYFTRIARCRLFTLDLFFAELQITALVFHPAAFVNETLIFYQKL
jgi:hypothetical protein